MHPTSARAAGPDRSARREIVPAPLTRAAGTAASAIAVRPANDTRAILIGGRREKNRENYVKADQNVESPNQTQTKTHVLVLGMTFQTLSVLHQETDGKGGGIEEEGATEEGMEVQGGRCREEGGEGSKVGGRKRKTVCQDCVTCNGTCSSCKKANNVDKS